MASNSLDTLNIGFLVVIVCIFIYLLHSNILQDISDNNTLDSIQCHKEVDIPEIKNMDKLVVESIIEEYLKKRAMNKSNYDRIWGDVISGGVKGALSGAIIGGTLISAIEGVIVYGTISGTHKAYTLLYGKDKFLSPHKHT